MRGTVAKKLRTLSFGNQALRPTKYGLMKTEGGVKDVCIICIGPRALYQALKKRFREESKKR